MTGDPYRPENRNNYLAEVSVGYINREIVALLELETEMVNASKTGDLEKLRDMLYIDESGYYSRNTQRLHWRGSLIASGLLDTLKLEEKDIKKK